MTDPEALGVGQAGTDYLPKPFTIEQLCAKVRSRAARGERAAADRR